MPDSSDNLISENDRLVALQAEFKLALEGMTLHFQHDDGLGRDVAVDQVAQRFEKLIESARGPVFDNDGYIPPIEARTEAEVARWFGGNKQRQELLERVRKWISLAKAVRARRLLLDGSFVTAKDEPNDVDAVVMLPENFRDQLGMGKREAVEIRDMYRSREPKELFAAEDEEDWWRWVEFFGRTREANGRRKGLIEVML